MINMTKINNAIAESISNGTRPTISIKAPDIYSVTALIASPDASAIAFGPSWHVDGTTDNGDSFELSIMVDVDYSEYTIYLSDEASYYGSECTDEQAEDIAMRISSLAKRQFPNLVTEIWSEGDGSCSTTGPNDDTCDEITQWMQENSTAVL
jgi:hypothetical protein